MPIKVKCPGCGAVHQVGDTMAGKRAKCKCGGVIAIPAPRAPAAPSPAARAPQAASPFGGLADDEMDDLFGAPPGETPTPQPGSVPAAEQAVPANLVGVEAPGAKKKDNKPDPNALTPKDRRIAIMGIIAGILAVPYGILVAVIGLIGWVMYLIIGGALMAIAGIGVPILSIRELSGHRPQSDVMYQFGTFGSLVAIALLTLNAFIGASEAYIFAQKEVEPRMKELAEEAEKGLSGLEPEEEAELAAINAGLTAVLFTALGIAAVASIGLAIIPGFFMYVCRSHKMPPKEQEGDVL